MDMDRIDLEDVGQMKTGGTGVDLARWAAWES